MLAVTYVAGRLCSELNLFTVFTKGLKVREGYEIWSRHFFSTTSSGFGITDRAKAAFLASPLVRVCPMS